ncbi:unnamed protein product [Allacma fusca]|uniref:RB1-inducible coiled-coil protein 1 n=1 Tax=Allacma fusca TaxID=39272 RepID=A0A8J2Q7N3_9HEXA|nr:unnamed protein product [Allacma fusca]
MLYVFQVDTGTMITFDMTLALNTVSNLKEAIWSSYRIPVDRQVLLVSGGECLDPASRVCSYSAGTDTNPIFLFNKTNIESSPTSSGQHAPSSGSLENLTDIDSIKDQIKGCLDLPPTYMTVVSRAQLAQQLWEMAKDLSRRCEQLIHDQHLQHQGWAAVVANLEDVIVVFRQRAENFENAFMVYLGTKDDRLATLDSFEEDVALLREIPIIPSLLPSDSPSGDLTILDWIISQDNQKLESLSSECYKGLEKLNMSVIEALQREKKQVIENAENNKMKEIKGLEDRFFELDRLLNEGKTVVQDQYILAQAFLNNQNSASNERDSSILPDLCQAHQQQLMLMFRKHQHLDEIRRKCAKAKDELIGNLNTRLKWIMYVQHGLNETSNKLAIYNESLRRVRCQIEVVEQIHVAASIYGEAVVEVVRRKKFSESYNKWANQIAETMDKIHANEINLRNNFSARFEGHFLSALFSGLEDFPILFGNKRTEPFDLNLPTIPPEDIEMLRKAYPALPVEEELPDFTIDVSSTSRASEESSRSAVEIENLNLKLELERAKFELQTKDYEIQRLESLQAEEKDEFERTIKNETELRTVTLSEKDKEIQSLRDSIASLMEQHSSLSEVTTKEMRDLREELELIKTDHDKSIVEIQHRSETVVIETREKLLEEKENELRALREKHKAELEGLRSRYKLMSSFDQRSPSDIQDKSFDSLERIPRTDDLLAELGKVADLSQKNPNDGIINQMIKGIITRLEGSAIGMIPQSPEKGSTSPAILRARAGASEEGPMSRASIEAEEEPAMGNVKSVYGLDTSAIDATAMCNSSDDSETMSQELSEILIPSSDIVNLANNFAKAGRITIQSCKAGDNVFIYFNDKLKAYLVYLSNKNVYFLHTDCLKMLDHSQECPVKGFLAQVTEREFCVARRANNRYRVPQGFHFHRIRVKVLQIINDSSSK